jgi:DNA polymerase I-like protein with 3'-5' exonuclease and polymerase domains/intein/homing endonuclease
MIVVLSESFLSKRDNVRKGVIDLISSTVDKISADAHPSIKLDNDVVIAVQNKNFSWSKYNKDHKVAVVFTKEVSGKGALTPQKQWYWSEEAQMYIIECWPATRVVTWAEGYPEFYYAFEKAMNFDYYYDLAQRAKKVEYHVIQSFDDPVFVQVRDNVKLLGCDIETRGFSWTKDPITVNGFCYEEGKVMIIPQDIVERSKENWDAFKAFVEDKDKSFIWQNGKFDTKFYRHNGWDARVDEDIMLISYALDERSGGIHQLEYQATKILNTDGYKHKIDFETVDMYDKALHYYLAQDCCYTYMLFNHYMKMAEKKSHEHSFRLYRTVLLKASWALLRLEENGFYINRPYTESLEKDYRTKLIEAENNLDRIATSVGYTPLKFQEWSGQKSLPKKFSPGAPKQLAFVLIELLGLPKYKGTLTTDASAMMGWLFDTLDFPNKDVNEFLSTPEDVVNEWLEDSLTPQTKNKKLFLWNLLNFRKLKKMYSTYITNTLEYSKDDGRIHVTYKIHGTVTGRLSSGDPMNLQNIPRKKDIKNIFKAPEGKTLIECDYSQCIRKGTKVYSTNMNIEDHPDAVHKGEARIFNVRTDKGYSVQCTDEHQILTQRGWVEAKDLRTGDFIALQGQEVFKTNSDPLARFVGFFAGDGSYQKTSISVARGEDKYLEDLYELIHEAGLETRSTQEYSIYVSTTPAFREWLKTLVCKENLRVPEIWLEKGKESELASYLGGLFDADGYADKNCIAFSTKFFDLAHDVQKALLKFGIMSRVLECEGGYNYVLKGAISFRVVIADQISRDNFNKLIGFRLTAKRDQALMRKTMSLTNLLPTLTTDEVLKLRKGKDNAFYRKYVLNYIGGRIYSRFAVKDLDIDSKHTRYHWDKFESFTDTGIEDDVYDLMDQPETRFVANGVVVHNCELRVLAYLSQDPDMIETYKQDGDLHDAVATKMFGPNFTKEQRVGAKTVNFGLAYGRGKSSVAEQLRCSYQFASDLVDQWHESMPVASEFITKTRAKPKAGERCVTPLGRERRFWLINHHNENTCENESINFPIQSLASDFALLALYKFLHILEQDPVKWKDVFPVNIVHDAILVEAPDNMVDEAVEVLSGCMVNVPKEILPDLNVPMKAEAEVTKIGWGKKSEWKPGCVSELPLE